MQDWVTIWHSELAALAVDREQQEAVLRGIDALGGAWGGVAAMVAAVDAEGRAGPDAAAGAAAVAAASDAGDAGRRDAELRALERRVAELEARLGEH